MHSGGRGGGGSRGGSCPRQENSFWFVFVVAVVVVVVIVLFLFCFFFSFSNIVFEFAELFIVAILVRINHRKIN